MPEFLANAECQAAAQVCRRAALQTSPRAGQLVVEFLGLRNTLGFAGPQPVPILLLWGRLEARGIVGEGDSILNLCCRDRNRIANASVRSLVTIANAFRVHARDLLG